MSLASLVENYQNYAHIPNDYFDGRTSRLTRNFMVESSSSLLWPLYKIGYSRRLSAISELGFLLLVVFPTAFIMLGIVGYLLFKNIFIAPILVILICLLLTYQVYNTTFLPWAFLYTLLSFICSFITKKMEFGKII